MSRNTKIKNDFTFSPTWHVEIKGTGYHQNSYTLCYIPIVDSHNKLKLQPRTQALTSLALCFAEVGPKACQITAFFGAKSLTMLFIYLTTLMTIWLFGW